VNSFPRRIILADLVRPSHRIAEGSELRVALLFRLSQVCSSAKLAVKRIARRMRVRKRGRPLLRCLVFGELCRREFAALDVAFVDLRKLLPLLRQVLQRENRGHRADRHTGGTVYALDAIDVELRDFIEAGTAIIVGRVLLGVDAVYGAGIDAGGVLHPDAGLSNDVRHRPPPSSALCSAKRRFKRCRA
jgi:hypothetical protein